MTKLEKQILSANPFCNICEKTEATSVHSFLLKNKIEKIKDCIPICDSCKKEIQFAIEYNFISQNPKDLDEIKSKTLLLLKTGEFEEFKIFMNEKRYLTAEEIQCIESCNKPQMRKINSLIKKDLWYGKLKNIKLTEKEIFQIVKVMKTFFNRNIG